MSSHVSALIPAAAPPLPRAPPLDARGHHKEDARKPPCPLRGAVHGQGLQHRSLHTSEDETRPDIRCINIDAAMPNHDLLFGRARRPRGLRRERRALPLLAMPLSAKGQGCKERAQPEQPAADGLPSTRSPQDWQLALTLQRQAASTWAVNAGGGDDGVAVLVITSAT